MKWSFWIDLYIRTHCVARGLRPLTLVAYENTLKQFHEWVQVKCADCAPDEITTRDVLSYVQYLREVRDNGASAVNRAVVVLRRFYGAMVAMGYLEPSANPLAVFPSIKAVPRKLPIALSQDQVSRLLAEPKSTTVMGVRDRALLALLYRTGIRASECAALRNSHVDLAELTITVRGKGGHERVIPLNPQLAELLRAYVQARGPALASAPFSDRVSEDCFRAVESMSACARGDSEAVSVFVSHRIACAIPLPLIWFAPVSDWSRSAICLGIAS